MNPEFEEFLARDYTFWKFSLSPIRAFEFVIAPSSTSSCIPAPFATYYTSGLT
jgi:hypothetical protein